MYRMQFRLKDKAEDLFRHMVDKTGQDPRELVMDALAVYDVALDEISKGRSFGSYSPEDRSFEGVWTPMLRAWQNESREVSAETDLPDVDEAIPPIPAKPKAAVEPEAALAGQEAAAGQRMRRN